MRESDMTMHRTSEPGITTRARRAGLWTAVSVLGAALLIGCSAGGSGDVGVVALTDDSAEIVATQDGTALRISATVVNVSDDVLDDVVVTIVLDDQLDEHLAGPGAVDVPLLSVDNIYPADTPRSEVPPDGALGIEINDSHHLGTPRSDNAEILDLADAVTLKVTWDGGQQVLTFAAPVQDPSGLLER